MADPAPLNRLRPGEEAPDFNVQLADGGVAKLEDYSGNPLLLIFVRHLACLPCQQHLHELQNISDTIQGSGASTLVVSFDGLEEVRHYKSMLNVGFPVASDRTRAAYRAYGLARASFFHTWHPKTLWRYVSLLRRGRRLQRPKTGDDLSQLGADFVVDAKGRLTYTHYSERPDDRPPVSEIAQAVAAPDG